MEGKRICSKLQVDLEEKYQDTLMMEKKWLKEQDNDIKHRVENKMMLAKAHCDKEQKKVWANISFQLPFLKTQY